MTVALLTLFPCPCLGCAEMDTEAYAELRPEGMQKFRRCQSCGKEVRGTLRSWPVVFKDNALYVAGLTVTCAFLWTCYTVVVLALGQPQ